MITNPPPPKMPSNDGRLEIAIRFLEARLRSGQMTVGQMDDNVLKLALGTARRLIEIERETRR